MDTIIKSKESSLPISEEKLEKFSKRTIGKGLYGGDLTEIAIRNLSFKSKAFFFATGFVFSILLNIFFILVGHFIPTVYFFLELFYYFFVPIIFVMFGSRRGESFYFSWGMIFPWVLAVILELVYIFIIGSSPPA
jgi:hypothetical protein